MSHRDRNEQRSWKARKDPNRLARHTKPHILKTVYDEDQSRVEREMLDEIDEFFAEYMEPDPWDDEIIQHFSQYVTED